MFASATVEKTTTYKLSKKEIEEILLKEAGLDRMAAGVVKIKWECVGGYDGYDDKYSSYTPMDVYSATITVTEKSKS